jgi:hypothetical protein
MFRDVSNAWRASAGMNIPLRYGWSHPLFWFNMVVVVAIVCALSTIFREDSEGLGIEGCPGRRRLWGTDAFGGYTCLGDTLVVYERCTPLKMEYRTEVTELVLAL